MLENCKGRLTHVIGDFNSKTGAKDQDERIRGKFGLGERNNRRQLLVDFAA